MPSNYKWDGTGKPLDLNKLKRYGCMGASCPFQDSCRFFCLTVGPMTMDTIGRRREDGLWECSAFKLKK